MRRSRLPRRWTIASVIVVFLLLLVLAVYLDGKIDSLFKWSTVGETLLNLLFYVYILLVYPYMLRSRQQAVLAFKPLLSLDDNAFDKVVKVLSQPNRRQEWVAVFLGIIVLAGGLGQPWTLDWTAGSFWLTFYYTVATAIGAGLMGWLSYDALVGIVRVSRLSRRDLKLDILDTETLAPVAAWSLGMSFVFVGIILLSTVTEVFPATEFVFDYITIIGYTFLIGVTLLIFFLSMWNVHRAMREAKNSKMTLAREHLAVISREMEGQAAKGQWSGMMELSSTITAWATYEKRAKEAPTWPFNAAVVRKLMLSVLTPGVVYLVRFLSQLGIRFDF